VACRKSDEAMLKVSKRKGGTSFKAFLGNFVHICTLVHSVLQVCMVRGWIKFAYCSINYYTLALRNQAGYYRIH